jgi:hypothetical protein
MLISALRPRCSAFRRRERWLHVHDHILANYIRYRGYFVDSLDSTPGWHIATKGLPKSVIHDGLIGIWDSNIEALSKVRITREGLVALIGSRSELPIQFLRIHFYKDVMLFCKNIYWYNSRVNSYTNVVRSPLLVSSASIGLSRSLATWLQWSILFNSYKTVQ